MGPRIRAWLAAALTGLLAVGIVSHSGCRKETGKAAKSASIAGSNVLLITLDTTRADRLGCYGYAAAQTPTLDAIAGRGTLFEEAFAQAPLTLPSHCSMMTGRYPKEHGIHDNDKSALGQTYPTLAAIFKSKGYLTAAFIAAFVLDSRFGLDRGFDVYDDDMGEISLGSPQFAFQRRADAVTDRCLTWLEANKGAESPFFCWIHYFDPHEGYDPPEPFRSAHAHAYDGEIAFMDSQIKRVWDWVRASGLAEKTLIVVVGDHGESLGEHDYTGHSLFLYETNLRVPMIFVHGGLIPVGKRVPAVVEVADVFPTVLDLFNWEAPQDLMTRSLAAAFDDRGLTDCESYAESLYGLNAHEWAQQRSLTTRQWKYISSAKPELYDRLADRSENHNLHGAKLAVAASMLAKLKGRYESMVAGEAADVEIDASAREALESLGYAGGKTTIPDEFLSAGLADPKDMLDVLRLMKQGSSHMARGEFGDAVRAWHTVLARMPGSADVLSKLGTCYLKIGDFGQAQWSLEQALDADPSSYFVLMTMGDLLVAQDRLDEAVEYYRAALAGNFTHPWTCAKLGKTLGRLGRTDEAIELYRAALEQLPDFPKVHAHLGTLLLSKGLFAESIDHLQRALARHPEYTVARGDLGLALVHTGKAVEGTAHLREAVARNPEYTRAILRAGAGALNRGDMAGAKQVFEAAATFDGIAAEAHYNLAMIASHNGDHARAATSFERAIKANPSNTASFTELAGYYLSSGRIDDAVRILRLGAQRFPDVRMTRLLAVLLATSQNDQVRNGPEAVSWAQRAIELGKESNPTDLVTLAAAFAESGEFEKAIETGERALQAAETAGSTELADVINTQLELYRSGKPYRHERF